jgi:hypothetical protein
MEIVRLRGGREVLVPATDQEWRALPSSQLDDLIAKTGGESTMPEAWYRGHEEKRRREART